MAIDDSKVEEFKELFKKGQVEEKEHEEPKEPEEAWKVLAKYFAHGIAFSPLFAVLAIAWVFGLVILVMLGSIIGLIIGLGLLILIVGFVNAVITARLWFPVKSGFWDILAHGFVLFIALLIVNGIFVAIPRLVLPGIITSVITFIIASFLGGFVCKKVASWWREGYPRAERIPTAIEREWRNRRL